MTDRIAHTLELCVGIMLVVLGTNVLRTLVRRGAGDRHDHAAGVPHSHADKWAAARPFFVGMVHGLAGSAPLLVLTLTVISSPFVAFSYLGVFGIGSIMGMAMMSLLVSVPAWLTVEHFARTNLALRGLSGSFSVGLGFLIVYQNGVVNGLFA